jgi:hypothetical protein
VINIGADGKCESYVETATDEEIKKIAIYKPGSKEPLLILDEPQRGQRAKCNVYDDACDDIVKINTNQPKKSKHIISDHLCDIKCISAHYAEDGELYCKLIQDFPERPSRCSAYDDGADK